jgi:beta-glucanase (GH16 family)
MKKLVFLLLAIVSLDIKSQTPINDPHWSLLWEDNFDVLNTTIWNVKNNFDHYGGENEVYTNRSNNVFINSGNLVLRCINESYSCLAADLNINGCAHQATAGVAYNYTSGYVESKPPYTAQYGYLEARIKLPYSNGLWPAFWTFSGTSGYQEIDIFEMTPGLSDYCPPRNASQHLLRTNNIMGTNIHLNAPGDECTDPYALPSTLMIQDYTQWHTYGIEWSPSKIVWYIDNYPSRYYFNSQITAPTSIILNLAVNNGYAPSSPADMLVDYVRVYQLNKDCDDVINTSTYDFLLYNNREKNFIDIGSGGGTNSLPVGQDITLRASQYINFSGDFTVPEGAALYADANHECPIDKSADCSLTFNPCVYDFSGYDNTVKQKIVIGSTGCPATITPVSTTITFQAVNEIDLGADAVIIPTSSLPVELKIVTCP